MQAKLHKKYDLVSSRKRSRMKDQNKDSTSKGYPNEVKKGKKTTYQISPKESRPLSPPLHRTEASKVEKSPLPSKPLGYKERESAEYFSVDKSPVVFNIQK